jgi:hypothetical protein
MKSPIEKSKVLGKDKEPKIDRALLDQNVSVFKSNYEAMIVELTKIGTNKFREARSNMLSQPFNHWIDAGVRQVIETILDHSDMIVRLEMQATSLVKMEKIVEEQEQKEKEGGKK